MSSFLPGADQTASTNATSAAAGKLPSAHETRTHCHSGRQASSQATSSDGHTQHAQQPSIDVTSKPFGPLTSATEILHSSGPGWDRRFRHVNQSITARTQHNDPAEQPHKSPQHKSPEAQERQFLQTAARSVLHARFMSMLQMRPSAGCCY